MDEEKLETRRPAKKKKKMRKGGMNLVLLGVFAVLIATITTGVSLIVYHNSGDIYLDRSRPGYLPDEEEIEDEEEKELEYQLDRTGKINLEIINEYLKNLDFEIKAVDAYEKPFNQDVLSDQRLGIPAD